MTQFTAVYLDGELVDQRMSSGAYVSDAPADEHTYKVVTDTTLDAARWQLATKGHSEWTFRSAETPEDRWTFLPLINLGFDVDTDLAGEVRGGNRLPVGIGAEYVAGARTRHPGIGGGRLEVSYDDGKSWRKVRLHDGDGAAVLARVSAGRDVTCRATRSTSRCGPRRATTGAARSRRRSSGRWPCGRSRTDRTGADGAASLGPGGGAVVLGTGLLRGGSHWLHDAAYDAELRQVLWPDASWSAVARTSSGGRLRIAAASSGAMTEK